MGDQDSRFGALPAVVGVHTVLRYGRAQLLCALKGLRSISAAHGGFPKRVAHSTSFVSAHMTLALNGCLPVAHMCSSANGCTQYSARDAQVPALEGEALTDEGSAWRAAPAPAFPLPIAQGEVPEPLSRATRWTEAGRVRDVAHREAA